jgi:hypothetical protein
MIKLKNNISLKKRKKNQENSGELFKLSQRPQIHNPLNLRPKLN